MAFKELLENIGVAIVQERVDKDAATLYLRVAPEAADTWESVLFGFLLALEERCFIADVSKYFFVVAGGVRYLWRIAVPSHYEGVVAVLAEVAGRKPTGVMADELGAPRLTRKAEQLDAALRRVGAHIVKEQVEEKAAIRYLVVDLEQGEKWVHALREFLVVLPSKKPALTADASKCYFVRDGQLRYLWRVSIQGDVMRADALFTACALEASMVHTAPVMSMPLVGRIEYPFDPARGKLKGGHELDQAVGILNVAIGGVAVGGAA